MSNNFLNSPIEYLKTVGPGKADLLKKEFENKIEKAKKEISAFKAKLKILNER